MCVKIPMFQSINPIYLKAVRELCLRKPGRKNKDPQIVHVMGKLLDLIMGRVLTDKYFDPGSPVVNVKINNKLIRNTLIDLGVPINA
jgi:hypothetical protein